MSRFQRVLEFVRPVFPVTFRMIYRAKLCALAGVVVAALYSILSFMYLLASTGLPRRVLP